MLNQMRWRINRFVSMSPKEIPHRIQERLRMGRDATYRVSPLPILFENHPLPKWPVDLTFDIPKQILRSASDILADRLFFLGQHWTQEKHWAWGWDPCPGHLLAALWSA